MTINKPRLLKEAPDDVGQRAVTKPSTPKKTSPAQKVPDPESRPWPGGVDHFSEGA